MVRQGSSAPLGAILGVAALLSVGCNTPREGVSQTDDGVNAIQFSDIPIPAGLELKERAHASSSLEIGEYRHADFTYAGSVPIAEVSAYLRERMPQHAWSLTGETVDKEGNGVLSFERGMYRAECTLSRDNKNTRTQLKVKYRTSLEPEK